MIGAAAAGAIIGDNCGYWIGRELGFPLVYRFGHYIRLDEKRLKVGQYLFLRHGGKIVFFGRFVAVLRAFAAFLAGVNRYNWEEFFLFNAAGGIVWATIFGTGGYLLGRAFEHYARPVGIAALIVAVIWRGLRRPLHPLSRAGAGGRGRARASRAAQSAEGLRRRLIDASGLPPRRRSQRKERRCQPA